MLIQPARPADLPAIVDLVNGAYRGEAARRGWTSEAAFIGGQRTSLALLESELAGSTSKLILTARQSEDTPLIGCTMLGQADPETRTLGMLSVAPECQNLGVGKRLIAAAEALALSRGERRIRIEVVQIRDALLIWYERHGFVRTGETEPFPYGDQRFGQPLRDDLHFVVLEKRLEGNRAAAEAGDLLPARALFGNG